MSITDNLREYIDMFKDKIAAPATLRVIADSIDATHEREVNEAQMNAIYMPNHRVALPYDADGVQIDFGDEMYRINDRSSVATVEVMTLTEDGWKVDGDEPSHLRHWDRSTVEELLLDFSDKVLDSDQWGADAEDTIDEYAERIRKSVEHEEEQ